MRNKKRLHARLKFAVGKGPSVAVTTPCRQLNFETNLLDVSPSGFSFFLNSGNQVGALTTGDLLIVDNQKIGDLGQFYLTARVIRVSNREGGVAIGLKFVAVPTRLQEKIEEKLGLSRMSALLNSEEKVAPKKSVSLRTLLTELAWMMKKRGENVYSYRPRRQLHEYVRDSLDTMQI